jgi:hypothetical protein
VHYLRKRVPGDLAGEVLFAGCKQKAHRGRGGKRNADRNADTVTVTAPTTVIPLVRSAEAVAVLAELDAELAENSRELGEPLDYSAAERVVREMVASEIDRKVWLSEAYNGAGNDVGLRVKLATELRLTEQSVARLLKQINTDLPEPVTPTSRKARQAANTRWQSERSRG